MISAILLSAGLSKRFGSPKALAKINGLTVIQYLQNTLIDSNIDEIIVVLGDHFEDIKSHILNHTKVRVVYNKDYNLGQTLSLKTGLRHISAKAQEFMIFPVDMPLIKKETINLIIDKFHKDKPKILIPTYQNQKGHPPVFTIEFKNDLLKLNLSVGLNTFEHKHVLDIMLFPVEDSGILKSFNTPEEFKSLVN